MGNPSSYWASDDGDDTPMLDTYPRTWDAGSWRTNRNATTVATGLIGWFCTVAGHPGTWIPIYAFAGATGGLPRVANIAALAALDCSAYSATQAHLAEVLTVGDFFKHSPTGARGTWSAATAYVVGDVVWDGTHSYVAIAAGTNHAPASSSTFWTLSVHQVAAAGVGVTSLWVRLRLPNQSWQKLSTNGTGFFIDPTSGDDENLGTSSGVPLKTCMEFNTRLRGANGLVAARLTVIGVGSSVFIDREFNGWTGTMFLVGTPTVVAAGVALTAATDTDGGVGPGSITSTAVDFNGLGYKSTTTRTLWARRANTVGTLATYAPLYRTRNSGADHIAEIGPQVEFNTSTLSATSNPPAQLFAAGDSVDLISLPTWRGLKVDKGISIQVVLMDLAANGSVAGTIGYAIVGHRGLVTATSDGTSVVATGLMLAGSFVFNANSTFNLRHFQLGYQGIAATAILNSTGAMGQIETGGVDTGLITASQSGSLIGDGEFWIQNTTPGSAFSCSSGGRMKFPTSMSIGVGALVTSAVVCASGGSFEGWNLFSTTVNNFVSATPWSTDGGVTSFASSRLSHGGYRDEYTQCAIVEAI